MGVCAQGLPEPQSRDMAQIQYKFEMRRKICSRTRLPAFRMGNKRDSLLMFQNF